MGRPCCHRFIAFLLKFLNFLQFFIGLCIIVYSAYMLTHWNRHHHHEGVDGATMIPADVISILGSDLQLNLHSLPAPWFIYAFMGVGIALCCITCIGHIGAEAFNGCCLCFYVMLSVAFVLLEVSLVVFIALDHSWEKDLPFDPTGELDNLRAFTEGNVDICKWVGIAVIIMQGLSLLLALILRALVSGLRAEDDIEEVYSVRGRSWEPHLSQAQSDIWSSRMREKYGLNNSDMRYTLLSQNSSNGTRFQQ